MSESLNEVIQVPLTATFTLEEIQEMIIPALHVCRGIQLNLQGHDCRYQNAADKGTHGLTKMFYLAQERSIK